MISLFLSIVARPRRRGYKGCRFDASDPAPRDDALHLPAALREARKREFSHSITYIVTPKSAGSERSERFLRERKGPLLLRASAFALAVRVAHPVGVASRLLKGQAPLRP